MLFLEIIFDVNWVNENKNKNIFNHNKKLYELKKINLSDN